MAEAGGQGAGRKPQAVWDSRMGLCCRPGGQERDNTLHSSGDGVAGPTPRLLLDAAHHVHGYFKRIQSIDHVHGNSQADLSLTPISLHSFEGDSHVQKLCVMCFTEF